MSEVSICTFYTRVLRTSTVLTFLRTYEAIFTDLPWSLGAGEMSKYQVYLPGARCPGPFPRNPSNLDALRGHLLNFEHTPQKQVSIRDISFSLSKYEFLGRTHFRPPLRSLGGGGGVFWPARPPLNPLQVPADVVYASSLP